MQEVITNSRFKPIGLYGCSCHPFENWKECDLFHSRKFHIGDRVQHRCLRTIGRISKVMEKGFVLVKYGERPCDNHLEHAANLEPILDQLSLF